MQLDLEGEDVPELDDRKDKLWEVEKHREGTGDSKEK